MKQNGTTYQKHGKRLADLLIGGIALAALSPLILASAGVIRLLLGKPVLFRQSRPGKEARPFTLVKFRTMTNSVDRHGKLMDDQRRLTRLGAFLRATSLDELPSLFNVLRGDMSLVGPRPLLPEYLPLYTPTQARRHEVRPGITGWAQVNGRNALTWEQKFEMDVWYVDHQSFLLDLKILALTVWKVFRREGISQAGHVTAEPFRGSGRAITNSPDKQ